MATPTRPTDDHFIFGDESSRTDHDFLVVGTMDCPRQHRDEIVTRLHATLKGHSEYAWSRSPSRDMDHFVDEIFYFIRKKQLWFRCMVVYMPHANHKKYSDGDKDLSLEKYIFQHLYGYARRASDLVELTRFYVELDNRTEKYKGPNQMRALNNRFFKETGHRWPIFADVTDVDSKAQIMVQAADVLAGCVAWVWNRQDKNKVVDPERKKFAARIADHANLHLSPLAQKHGIEKRKYPNFGYVTLGFQETRNFSIWRMNMRKEDEDKAVARSAEIIGQHPPTTTFNDLAATYEIGLECFACDRHKRDILPVIGTWRLRNRRLPPCSQCGGKGYLRFTKRRVPR